MSFNCLICLNVFDNKEKETDFNGKIHDVQVIEKKREKLEIKHVSI